MNFVAVLRIVISLATKLAEYVRDKQLMDAGAAEATLRGIKDADDAIARANAARANADSLPVDEDPANRRNNRRVD